MTSQGNKPSCHDVITGRWTPSSADNSAGRVAGFGVITNIINGGIECGHGSDSRVEDRIGFYQRYCEMLGVFPGDNLNCGNQSNRLPFLLQSTNHTGNKSFSGNNIRPSSLCNLLLQHSGDKHSSPQASSTSTTTSTVEHFNQNLQASCNRGLKRIVGSRSPPPLATSIHHRNLLFLPSV
ncbi:hypothetical protein PIB30_024306 [Stylosanthes scabra]|uniref:chitinase n=1 Tax=Stylosanthes scabra TaxID=79078 RepID=A0ABU6X7U3_9FABA|nr:hypothetical protein [Stylosanthes scabra]